MDISVVIPLYNECDSLKELAGWIDKVMVEHNFTYEVIFVDDGSEDESWNEIEEISRENVNIKGVKFKRNYGKSAALNCGFEEARGDVVITMDADLQDSPDEIPDLYKMIKIDGFDLVSGWKRKRYDPFIKKYTSRFYNWTTRRVSGIKLHDFNCGLKAYKKEVVKHIEVYGEMHRYIPVIAKWLGFKKIGEKVVQHRERKYGDTKFGLDRFVKGYLDLLSITFISKFGRRPMHFFGTMGTIIFILGLLAAVWMGAQKLYYVHHGIKAILVTESPYFYISLVAMIIGTQLFLAGFLAEMISRNNPHRNHYLIERKIGIKIYG
jgi:glycosyltransferase involved in cell wall biosynthesis